MADSLGWPLRYLHRYTTTRTCRHTVHNAMNIYTMADSLGWPLRYLHRYTTTRACGYTVHNVMNIHHGWLVVLAVTAIYIDTLRHRLWIYTMADRYMDRYTTAVCRNMTYYIRFCCLLSSCTLTKADLRVGIGCTWIYIIIVSLGWLWLRICMHTLRLSVEMVYYKIPGP